MDLRKRSQQSGTRFFSQKSIFCFSILVTCVVFFTLPACQSKSISGSEVVSSDIKLPPGFDPAPIEQLTTVGVNSKPELSGSGEKLVYLSSLRPTHENTQAYLLEIANKSEKRITFQDGQVASIVFAPDDSHVIYSSSTDEIKEDSLFIKETLEKISGGKQEKVEEATVFWKRQPLELYSSFINGTRIERLTKSPLYDSDPNVHPQGKKVIFASARGDQIDLHLTSINGTYLKSVTKTAVVEAEPKFSPDGEKLVWVEYTPDMKESQIIIADKNGKSPQALTSAPYIHWNPHWLPDGKSLLISSNRDGTENYEVYRLFVENLCLERLTWHSSNDTEPVPTPDGQSFFFTSDRSQKKQVYRTKIKPASPCKS